MKTLIFNGSPRPNGDTSNLINALTKQLEGQYRIVNAYRTNISACIDCRYCWEYAGCAFKDDMNSVYDYIEECDNIIIASPIYFSELTGKLLDVGSRLQTYFCARKFRGEEHIPTDKRGAVLLVGGGDGSFDNAYDTAKTLLKTMCCSEIHPLVCSHNTNRIPAVEDENAIKGVSEIAAFFNEER